MHHVFEAMCAPAVWIQTVLEAPCTMYLRQCVHQLYGYRLYLRQCVHHFYGYRLLETTRASLYGYRQYLRQNMHHLYEYRLSVLEATPTICMNADCTCGNICTMCSDPDCWRQCAPFVWIQTVLEATHAPFVWIQTVLEATHAPFLCMDTDCTRGNTCTIGVDTDHTWGNVGTICWIQTILEAV